MVLSRKIGRACRAFWRDRSERVHTIVRVSAGAAQVPAPRTLKQEVFELHTLLKVAKISSPLVLVGQSIGALNVRLYTMKYGDKVAGIVLVDPTDESSMLFNLRANRWMKLRDQATGRTVPPERSSGR